PHPLLAQRVLFCVYYVNSLRGQSLIKVEVGPDIRLGPRGPLPPFRHEFSRSAVKIPVQSPPLPSSPAQRPEFLGIMGRRRGGSSAAAARPRFPGHRVLRGGGRRGRPGGAAGVEKPLSAAHADLIAL